MEKNRYIHYGVVLTIIAFVCALLLSVVNDFTSKVIAENDRKTLNAARIKVLPVAKDFIEADTKEVGGFKFLPGIDDSKTVVGYVVSGVENGYAGPIEFVMGVDLDGLITGLDIVKSSETPGLGAKINEQPWKDKWVGRDKEYKFDKGVDAFAGATISPTAVHTGVIKILNAYSEVK